MLEDVPLARAFGDSRETSRDNLDWTTEHLEAFATLLATPRFHLAVQCLTTHQHEANPRMAAISLWAGIEALLGIQSELRFRTAALVSAFLEPVGVSRVRRYRAVGKLYDFRSKAVHGVAMDDQALVRHIRDVRLTLSELLVSMVESGHVPSSRQWEEILFGSGS